MAKVWTIVAANVDLPGVRGSRGGYFCGECRGEVQLAPSGQSYVIANIHKVLCLRCFLEKPGRFECSVLPGSRAELLEHMAAERRN